MDTANGNLLLDDTIVSFHRSSWDSTTVHSSGLQQAIILERWNPWTYSRNRKERPQGIKLQKMIDAHENSQQLNERNEEEKDKGMRFQNTINKNK